LDTSWEKKQRQTKRDIAKNYSQRSQINASKQHSRPERPKGATSEVESSAYCPVCHCSDGNKNIPVNDRADKEAITSRTNINYLNVNRSTSEIGAIVRQTVDKE
jgi:hypothetical protein